MVRPALRRMGILRTTNLPLEGSRWLRTMSELVLVDFDDLSQTGNVEIACLSYGAVTRNSAALSEGTDFTYDGLRHMLVIPYTGTTAIEVADALTVFVVSDAGSAEKPSAPSAASRSNSISK